jgi:WD40 repeat protein
MNSIKKIKAFGLSEHTWFYDSVAFSSDGRNILSFNPVSFPTTTDRRSILLWDLQTGKLIRRLDGHKGDVVYVSFLPSGINAVSISEIGEIFYWDLANGNYQRIIEAFESEESDGNNKFNRASLTLDGRYLYIFYGLNEFQEIDLYEKKITGSFHITPEEIGWIVNILPDGTLFVCFNGKEAKIQVFDEKKKDQTNRFRIKSFSTGQSKPYNHIEVSKYGRYVATAHYESYFEDGGIKSGIVDIWDSYKQNKIQSFRISNSGLQISPNGRFFTDSWKIWNINTGEVVVDDLWNGNCAGFSPDDKYALLVHDAQRGDTAILVDLDSSGRLIEAVGGHGDYHFAKKVMFIEQSNQVITSGWLIGYTLLWDLNNGYSTHILNKRWGEGTRPIAISQNGGFAVTCSIHNEESQGQWISGLQIWDLKNGSLISESESTSLEYVCVLTPDQKYLLSSETIRDVTSGQIVRKFVGHKKYNRPICLSNSGYIVLSGCKDKSLILWSILTGEEIFRFEDISKIDFLAMSFDDKYAISIGGKAIRLWNLENKSLERVFDKDNKYVTCAAFVPKTNYLISAGGDKKVKIWDIKSGSQILVVDHTEKISSLTISHDSEYLYLVTDSEISTWEIDLFKLP